MTLCLAIAGCQRAVPEPDTPDETPVLSLPVLPDPPFAYSALEFPDACSRTRRCSFSVDLGRTSR